ncbi:MAG: hypothetical protein AMXMBFR34_06080 [Myxococcaceae bacterium]
MTTTTRLVTVLGCLAAALSFAQVKSGAVGGPTPPPVAPAPAAPPPAAPTAPPAAPAAPPSTPAVVSIPAGTSLLIRTVDPITSKSAAGSRFGVTVDADVVVNGQVLIKAGAKGYGKVVQAEQAGRLAGKSALAITLTDVEVNGKMTPVATDVLGGQGEGSGKKTAGGAAVGAIVGGVAGGGKGAAQGAAIGAGVSLLKKGQTIGVAPNTLLEFRLQAPVTPN